MIEVVGVGDDGWARMPGALQDVVSRADALVGGARHLSMVPETVAPRMGRHLWPSPLKPQLKSFVEGLQADLPEGNIVVLASGDPLRSGIASTLIDEFGTDEIRVYPALSSDVLARARMKWSAESVDVVTLVGRDPVRFLPLVTPGARLVILCSDGNDPAKIADLLRGHGLGAVEMTAWWHLGGEAEGSRSGLAREWSTDATPDLVVMCLQAPRILPGTASTGPAAGRPDDVFGHDGLITKRDVRASAMARLRPMPGALLWDLGAGSGAVGIEWSLAAPRAHVVSVEKEPVRAERIAANAQKLGVGDRVRIVRQSVLEAACDASLPAPDAIFVGGGLSMQLLEKTYQRLVPGGRLVAHAVTTESEALVMEAHTRWGGELVRLSVDHLEPLGRFHSWKPARSITSWSVTRPYSDERSGRISESPESELNSKTTRGASL